MRSLVSASLVVEPSEKDYTIHFQVRDIEQRHMIREQMAQADRLASIGQLSSGIAHEINNPLGVILGYTQLMLRNEPTDSDRRRDLKTIEKHVRHCKSDRRRPAELRPALGAQERESRHSQDHR